ncbi:PP2C family protein-serine/threonine phosphatase [Ilumatobacter sp.]|uniref:PP2C family protein-serine/threonine phosphatase n=1 Tax=Ilumatobacter sp. TaxID=1967498 RepID=UPI003C722006
MLPEVGCTEAAALYKSSNRELELGGDWYDLIDRSDNQIVAIVGDVVGHGVHEIAVMGQLRAAAHALAQTLPEPDEVLNALERFAADVPGARYATCAVLMLDGSTTGRLALAGHPAPILVRATGEVELLDAERGALMCVPGVRVTASFAYDVGDLIVLYTDGLVERRGTDSDTTARQVGDFVHQHREMPCRDLTHAVMDRFAGDADDDCVVVVLRPLNHRSPSNELISNMHVLTVGKAVTFGHAV